MTATFDGYGRTLLQALPQATPGGSLTGNFVPWAGDVTGEWFGNIGVHAVSAFVRDREREQELDARVIPGIPWAIQILVFMNLCLGLVAHQISWGWWKRIWPPEVRAEYGSAFGYQGARVVRLVAFLFVFLPLTGSLAFIRFILLILWDALHAPARWYRALRGRFSARSSA